MPSPSHNTLVPNGDLQLNSYAEARLIRVGSADPAENARFTVGDGSTLEIGGAGISTLGVGGRGEWIQKGGLVVMGNSFNIGGFLSSGNGFGHYLMEDGVLRIHGGDLVLGGNTTGSSESLFEQQGGRVELEDLLIGSERYRGMLGSNLNQSKYVAKGGELIIKKQLKIGSDSEGGTGGVDAVLQVGADAEVEVAGGLMMYAGKQSRPMLSFLADGSKLGRVKLSRDAKMQIAGQVDVVMSHGVTMLESDRYTVIESQAGQVEGSFESTTAIELWQLEMDTAGGVQIKLNTKSEKAELVAASGQRASFSASARGFIKLNSLSVGGAYRCVLRIDAGSGDSLESVAEAFHAAGFNVEIQAGKYLNISGVANASTQYLVWDFGGDFNATKISGIAF